jgi:hypothetical protein
MRSFKTLICLSIGLLAASCTRDFNGSGVDSSPEGRALVKFQLKTPRRTTSRDIDTGFENTVDKLVLFVLNDTNSDSAVYDFEVGSMIVVDDLTAATETSSVFTVGIEPSEQPVKFIVLANPTQARIDEFDDAYKAAIVGTTEEELRSMFADAFPQSVMQMYGEARVASLDPLSTVNLTIPLMRWVARVDLRFDLGVDSRAFIPEEAYIYRADKMVQLIPNLSAIESSNPSRVALPSRVAGAAASSATENFAMDKVTNYDDDPGIDPKIFASAYLPENEGATSADQQTTESTCVVVGGKFNGTEEVTYYRIDFNSASDDLPFGQILRNWKYVFNVVKVTSAGVASANLAATTVANSMTVEVTAWNENVSEVDFVGTGDYIMVSTNSLQMQAPANSTNTFSVRSTVPFQWQLDNDGTLNDSSPAATVANTNYEVTMTPGASEGDYTDYNFSVRALAINDNASDSRPAAIFITAQGATITVTLSQLASKAGTTKINVVSVGTSYGSLGESYEPLDGGLISTGSAAQMRYILLNTANYGPSGTVKTGGFYLEYIPTATWADDGNLPRLTSYLESMDVVNMNYPAKPTAAVSKMICDWLWADKNRVLIVARDDNDYNANLIAEINSRVDSNYDTSWSELADIRTALGVSTLTLASEIGAMPPDAIDGRNTPFLVGSFGPPANLTTEKTNITDGVAAGLNPPSGLVPVLYYSYKSVKGQYALLAVDVDHRIVYVGEVGSYSTGMSGSSTAPSPLDGTLNRVYSNLWEWIANQVMAE